MLSLLWKHSLGLATSKTFSISTWRSEQYGSRCYGDRLFGLCLVDVRTAHGGVEFTRNRQETIADRFGFHATNVHVP